MEQADVRTPVGVIVEIVRPDGEMARLPELIEFSRRHELVFTSIEKLEQTVARSSLYLREAS